VSAATNAQVPSAPLPFFAALHASQSPVQALSQQTESTQLPLAHSVPDTHAEPFGWRSTQAPTLHHLAPHSASGSVSVATLAHVPLVPPVLAAEHAMQSAVHAVLQHTPSTQFFEVQSVPSAAGVQVAPSAPFVKQAPVASQ